MSTATTLSLSVIVPIYNEEENIPHLLAALSPVLEGLNCPFEVVAVDDGSRDKSFEVLKAAAASRPWLKVVSFRRNAGQTAAMMAGIDYATGSTIVLIDADLQNDPADIPSLLHRLDEGYDVVSGWRKNRKDAAFRRNLPSRLANRLISWISGIELHDYGCSLKAYRRETLGGLRLYGEMHRFIPIYASWMGARVTEIPVTHRPRTRGVSKYGLERIAKVLLDIVVVKFLDKYFVKPIYVFGGFGILAFLLSFLAGTIAVILKLFYGTSFIQTPLPLLSVISMMLGVMSILMGLLAEILVRTYFESQGKTAYHVRHLINVEPGN